MCFKAFYIGINNIRLGFTGIERKTGREETRNIACIEDWFTEVERFAEVKRFTEANRFA